MKVCFIGLGSIGTRHIDNFNLILTRHNIPAIFDAVRRQKENGHPLIQNTWLSIDEMPSDYDIIFITNPTHLHYETLKQVVGKTKHIFIEKPVFDNIDYNIKDLKLKENGIYYVACPLRYNSVIQWAKEFVDYNRIIYARSICSSYLPDWRPSTDYRTVYSAHRSMGGGVMLDLIHEWDYLQYLFGSPKAVVMSCGKFSDLEITSEDTADYIAEYDDKIINLHLDYFGRVPRRQLELYTADDTIIIDLNSKTVSFLKENNLIELLQTRDEMQLAEMEYFLNIIDGNSENFNTIQTAIQTTKIALGENYV